MSPVIVPAIAELRAAMDAFRKAEAARIGHGALCCCDICQASWSAGHRYAMARDGIEIAVREAKPEELLP